MKQTVDASGESAPKKKRHVGLVISLTAAALAAGLGVSYCVYAEQYTQKFLEGTYINNMNVGNLTAEEVETAIKNKVEQYSVRLTFMDDQTETIDGSAFDFSYTPDGDIEKILAEQNKYSWIQRKVLKRTANHTVAEAYSYDEAKLREAVGALPEMQDANMTAPVNAYMQLGEDSRFTIVPEADGNTLNKDLVYDAVNQAVADGESDVDINAIDDVYEKATVRSDDENLNTQVNDLNGFLSTSITYRLHDGSTNTLDGNITKTWLAQSADDPNYYYIDTNKLQEFCKQFVAQLAGIDDDVRHTTTFHSTNRGDMELKCPEYGHKINQAQEASDLYQELLARTSGTKTPVYSMDKAEGGFGSTYVEIDIANQHVYVHQNGSIVFDSACVSGTATAADRATPTGVFQIFWKTTDRDLKGQIDPATGQPSYVSHVNFWMPFYRSVGMHDASWRSEYGGSIYKYSGSHGCVNLPYNAAKTIYGLVSVGTYVIVI